MENVLKVLQSYGKPMLRQCSYYTAEEFHNGFTLKTQEIFFVHTTLEEFENKGLTLKTHQMFCVHTTLEEFENGGFTLKTHQICFVHTRKRINCFPSILSRRKLKAQQSQAAETLECTREHEQSKVLVEPT